MDQDKGTGIRIRVKPPSIESDINEVYDVFENKVNKTGTPKVVDIPVDHGTLHGCLHDMMRLVRLANLKLEIGRDALRLAVHIFYRIVLLEKRYEYCYFVLDYEQFNETWPVYSAEYWKSYDVWYHLNFAEEFKQVKQDLQEKIQSRKISDNGDKKKIVVSGKLTAESNSCDQGPSTSTAGLQMGGTNPSVRTDSAQNERRATQYDTDDIEISFVSVFVNGDPTCAYMDRREKLKRCSHSKLVFYRLRKSGDFLMVPHGEEDLNQECHCFRMKRKLIELATPWYRDDVRDGVHHFCVMKRWCFINCWLKHESIILLKVVNPWVEYAPGLGLLAPCSLTDVKMISLKTTALKSLINSYLNFY